VRTSGGYLKKVAISAQFFLQSHNWYEKNQYFNLTFSKYLKQILGEYPDLQPSFINQKYKEWIESTKAYIFGNNSQ
jgi:hypothetical protein